MSNVEVMKVDRRNRNGMAVSVTQMIGNIRIEWGRGKNKKPIELSRGKPDARIYDPAQLEIPTEIYDAARKQVCAIFFPKKIAKSKQKLQSQSTLF